MPTRRPIASVAGMFNGIKKQMPSAEGDGTPSGKPIPNFARNAQLAMDEQAAAQGRAPRRRSFLPKKIRK